MASKAHAILGASSSHRWLHCTPSARLEQDFENTESAAAAEGSAAHALAEHKLKRMLKRRSKRPVSAFDCDEMEDCTDAYVQFVMEQFGEVRKSCRDPLIFIEQKLDFSAYVPDAFGTGDCIIVGEVTLHIIDFKYGRGVLVEAEENPQMKLYALGALELFGSLYDVRQISLSIFQPRRENVCTFSLSTDSLMKWVREELQPKARLAYAGEGDYCAGDWCTFCRASARCRERASVNLKLAQQEFKLPPLLTDDEVAALLGQLPELVKWANELMAYAADAAIHHGKAWAGFKVVAGRSCRRYQDEKAAAAAAKDAGYSDIYTQKLIGIGEMEKLMGRDKFQEILGSLIVKPAGKPTLVPASDKRPALAGSRAEDEFKNLEVQEKGKEE